MTRTVVVCDHCGQPCEGTRWRLESRQRAPSLELDVCGGCLGKVAEALAREPEPPPAGR